MYPEVGKVDARVVRDARDTLKKIESVFFSLPTLGGLPLERRHDSFHPPLWHNNPHAPTRGGRTQGSVLPCDAQTPGR
jgi:hypothetical protein